MVFLRGPQQEGPAGPPGHSCSGSAAPGNPPCLTPVEAERAWLRAHRTKGSWGSDTPCLAKVLYAQCSASWGHPCTPGPCTSLSLDFSPLRLHGSPSPAICYFNSAPILWVPSFNFLMYLAECQRAFFQNKNGKGFFPLLGVLWKCSMAPEQLLEPGDIFLAYGREIFVVENLKTMEKERKKESIILPPSGKPGCCVRALLANVSCARACG